MDRYNTRRTGEGSGSSAVLPRDLSTLCPARGDVGLSGWLMVVCPRSVVPSSSSAPSSRRPFVDTTGRTTLSGGMPLTRLNKKMAASSERKKMRAPAKKKLPTLPPPKQKPPPLSHAWRTSWK